MADDSLLDAHTDANRISSNYGSENAKGRKLSNLNDKLSRADDCFFWNGNLENLKRFVVELQLSGKCTSPGSDIKQFSNENVTLKCTVFKVIMQLSFFEFFCSF